MKNLENQKSIMGKDSLQHSSQNFFLRYAIEKENTMDSLIGKLRQDSLKLVQKNPQLTKTHKKLKKMRKIGAYSIPPVLFTGIASMFLVGSYKNGKRDEETTPLDKKE